MGHIFIISHWPWPPRWPEVPQVISPLLGSASHNIGAHRVMLSTSPQWHERERPPPASRKGRRPPLALREERKLTHEEGLGVAFAVPTPAQNPKRIQRPNRRRQQSPSSCSNSCKPTCKMPSKKETDSQQPSLQSKGQCKCPNKHQRSVNRWQSCKPKYKACRLTNPCQTIRINLNQQLKTNPTPGQALSPTTPKIDRSQVPIV